MSSAVVMYTNNVNGGTDVTCKNVFSGKVSTRTLKIDPTQLLEWSLNPRTPIQRIFPQLSDSDREFLMTGMTDEDWDEVMGPEE